MIAIIPARGGSKGLLEKNIKLLNGKPLIAYTIENAKKSKAITRIIISTDDAEIAKIAMEFGAECPFMRPEYLATDSAKSIEVYQYTLHRLMQEEGITIDPFMVLQPTSPLRTAQDIDNATVLFQEKNADSVVSYCAEHHPLVWHKYITEEGKFENIFEERINNRQDERKTYFPNGAIYIFRKKLIDENKYFTENSYAYIMDRKSSVDIDSLEDFEYAEFLLQKIK